MRAEVKPECLISTSSPWAEALDVRPIIPFQAVFAELHLHYFLHHLYLHFILLVILSV